MQRCKFCDSSVSLSVASTSSSFLYYLRLILLFFFIFLLLNVLFIIILLLYFFFFCFYSFSMFSFCSSLTSLYNYFLVLIRLFPSSTFLSHSSPSLPFPATNYSFHELSMLAFYESDFILRQFLA